VWVFYPVESEDCRGNESEFSMVRQGTKEAFNEKAHTYDLLLRAYILRGAALSNPVAGTLRSSKGPHGNRSTFLAFRSSCCHLCTGKQIVTGGTSLQTNDVSVP
jgi:hypothetical protein